MYLDPSRHICVMQYW